MRHVKARYQLNRVSSWRKATVISLAKSLLKYEQITTTLIRAKSARPVVERLIAGAKSGTLADRRRAFSILGEHGLVNSLYNDIAPRFKEINGGFTRILKLGKRRGDNAEMVVFELTHKKEKKAKVKEPKAEKALKPETGEAAAAAEKGHEAVKDQKPQKKFLGGIKKIFKKERDSL